MAARKKDAASARAEALSRLESAYGKAVVMRGSDEPPIDRVPLPSLSFNYMTGGGVPIGRWSRFYGGTHSGKSLKVWETVAAAQRIGEIEYERLMRASKMVKMAGGTKKDADDLKRRANQQRERWPEGMSCAYFNVEGQYDAVFTARRGVDIDELIVLHENKIESIGEMMEEYLKVVDLIVIDSCSEAVSENTLASDFGTKNVGGDAAYWKDAFKRLKDKSRFDRHRNMVIYVDQVTVKGIGSGSTWEGPPGGKYMEFASDMTVEFKPAGPWLHRDPESGGFYAKAPQALTLSGKAEPDAREVVARNHKSRVGRSGRTASMHLDYENSRFDYLHEYVQCAKFFVADLHGSYYYLPDGSNVQGEKQLRQRLEEDGDLRDIVWDAAMAAANPWK